MQWGGKALHQWDNLNFNLSIPGVERYFGKCVMLPMNLFVNDDDVKFICNVIREFYER